LDSKKYAVLFDEMTFLFCMQDYSKKEYENLKGKSKNLKSKK
jgi:hypothetical protein